MVKNETTDTLLAQSPPDFATKSKTAKAISEQRRAGAWSVDRWPMNKYVVNKSTRLHLPLSYLARDGLATKTVHPGEDVNQAVWKFYGNALQGKVKGENYVHADEIDERRHEYLGPDPRVAGYMMDSQGGLHVKWWDEFLNDQWIDDAKWKVEVKWTGQDWVEQ